MTICTAHGGVLLVAGVVRVSLGQHLVPSPSLLQRRHDHRQGLDAGPAWGC